MRYNVSEYFTDLGRDLRYGARLLGRSPGFTLAATVCLGIGIGLATSIFTQFQASIFKTTLGVDEPGSLVSFQSPVSFPDFEEYRDQSGQFESATAFLAPVPFVISVAGAQPERIWGHITTPDRFAAVQAMSSTLSAVAEMTKTSIYDPVVLIGAPLLLAGLALLACYLPARRSLRINPVEALRAE